MVSEYVKTFFFEGRSGELYLAYVYKTHMQGYISVCNLEQVQIGEVKLNISNKELYFIYNLHVYKKKRNDYIGSYMIEIMDELIKTLKYKNIYGDFEPSEPYLNEEYDKRLLEKQVMSFYRKNFFDIISYDEYRDNRNKYAFLEDKHFGTWKNKLLLYRNYVPSEYPFNEVGDIVVHNNSLERLDEIEHFVDNKLARLQLKVQ